MKPDLAAALKKIYILQAEPLLEKQVEKIIEDRASKRAKAAYEREFLKARVDELDAASLLNTLREIALPKQNKRGPKPRSDKGEVTSPATDGLKAASAAGENNAEEKGVSGE